MLVLLPFKSLKVVTCFLYPWIRRTQHRAELTTGTIVFPEPVKECHDVAPPRTLCLELGRQKCLLWLPRQVTTQEEFLSNVF